MVTCKSVGWGFIFMHKSGDLLVPVPGVVAYWINVVEGICSPISYLPLKKKMAIA